MPNTLSFNSEAAVDEPSIQLPISALRIYKYNIQKTYHIVNMPTKKT